MIVNDFFFTLSPCGSQVLKHVGKYSTNCTEELGPNDRVFHSQRIKINPEQLDCWENLSMYRTVRQESLGSGEHVVFYFFYKSKREVVCTDVLLVFLTSSLCILLEQYIVQERCMTEVVRVYLFMSFI